MQNMNYGFYINNKIKNEIVDFPVCFEVFENVGFARKYFGVVGELCVFFYIYEVEKM